MNFLNRLFGRPKPQADKDAREELLRNHLSQVKKHFAKARGFKASEPRWNKLLRTDVLAFYAMAYFANGYMDFVDTLLMKTTSNSSNLDFAHWVICSDENGTAVHLTFLP